VAETLELALPLDLASVVAALQAGEQQLQAARQRYSQPRRDGTAPLTERLHPDGHHGADARPFA
jgi:hypothetical protein